jgi:ribosomal protein L14E/L6E/L27E
VDHRTAALMLYALQTASANLKHTSFEPEPTHVVIDRDSVARRPIGATAWSKVEGREYDDLENDDLENNDLEEDEVEKDRAEKECVGKDAQEFMADLKRLTG